MLHKSNVDYFIGSRKPLRSSKQTSGRIRHGATSNRKVEDGVEKCMTKH